MPGHGGRKYCHCVLRQLGVAQVIKNLGYPGNFFNYKSVFDSFIGTYLFFKFEASMAHLVLNFSSRRDSMCLVQVEFRGFNLEKSLISVRSASTKGMHFDGSFKWSNAVKSLSLLFLRYKARTNDIEIQSIKGGRGSAASSLDFAISKQPQWLMEMFGIDSKGCSYINRIITRINPERKKPGPVILSVNKNILPTENVEVFFDGTRLVKHKDFLFIANSIESEFEERGQNGIKQFRTRFPSSYKVDTVNKIDGEKEVVLVITTSIRRPYFAKLIDECNKKFYETFGSKVRIKVRAVLHGEDFHSDASIAAVLREVESFSEKTVALVVVPIFAKYFTSTVASISAKYNLPVVAYTLPFEEDRTFKNSGALDPLLIMSDNYKGSFNLGIETARYLLSEKNRKSIHVLLIPGHEGRVDSDQRISGFCQGLREQNLKVICSTTSFCDWNRDKAYKEVLNLSKNTNIYDLDVIFAANDMMGLGARDALILISDCNHIEKKIPLVCGYDCIEEVKRLLKLGDKIFFGSVRQNLSLMAQVLASYVNMILSDSFNEGTKEFIEPEIMLNSIYNNTESNTFLKAVEN